MFRCQNPCAALSARDWYKGGLPTLRKKNGSRDLTACVKAISLRYVPHFLVI